MALTEPTRHLVGASLPRSGHHHLERLLGAALGAQLRYCEFYVPAGCCRAVPCSRTDAPIRFQKHHDFDGTLAQDLPGCHYVVQHREPVGGAMSDRELHVRRHNPALAGDEADHEHWLASRAIQHVDFATRWVRSPPASSTVIDYAELRVDAPGVVLRLLDDIGWAVDRDAVRSAVEAHVGVTAHDVHHRPGDPLDRPGGHPVLLARFESLVLAELGGDRPHRLAPAEWRGTPLEAMYRTVRAWQRGDLDAAPLDAALAAEPDHAGLLLQRGQHALRQGDPAGALGWLRRADERSPGNPPILLHLAACHRQLDDPEASIAAVAAVAALRPDVADHWAQLAAEHAALGHRVEAVAAVGRALAVDDLPDPWAPFPPELWAGLVGVADAVGDRALAHEVRRRRDLRWP